MLGNGGAEGGAQTPVVQVGIASWAKGCADHRFPSVFSRMSEVADWVKGTVCSRTGELCNYSKSGKNSKAKKTSEKCVKEPTFSPTITAPPFTPRPTYSPTITAPPYSYSKWPTWMPTECKFILHHHKTYCERINPIPNIYHFTFSSDGQIGEVALLSQRLETHGELNQKEKLGQHYE